MKEQNIHKICGEYGIKNYTINTDMSIDVNGDVYLSYRNLDKLPLKFRKVSRIFDCANNQLTTLEGSPIKVGRYFNCSNNKLTSLKGCPTKVGGNFICHNNQLITLEGCPIEVGGYFHCVNNKLTSLENGPQFVGDGFYCDGNPIYEEFKTKFNEDYNLYLKYTKRQKILNQLIND